MKKLSIASLLCLTLTAAPCLAQSSAQPPARAEDPAYTQDPRSSESYTVDEIDEAERAQDGTQTQRGPASVGIDQSQDLNAQSQPQAQPQAQPQSQPLPNDTVQNQSQPEQNKSPTFLENVQKQEKQSARRVPAANEAPNAAARSESQAENKPSGSQLAFFEITPGIGGISIKGKNAFSLGTNLSFRLAPNTALYFEPSLFLSFLSGDNNQNATIFHIDGGLRYDWIISDSPIVPFVKAAIGPSLASNDKVVVSGNEVGSSYFNVFAGGGLKLLINPHIGARVDAGVTLQGTDSGLYAMGSVALPL